MEQGQKSIGGQRADEKTLLGLPVVDELASGAAMYPAGRLPQIVDLQLGPVFAETVRQDSIGEWMPTQIEYRLPDCLQASDRLHRYVLTSLVLDCHLDSGVRTLVINLRDINQICFAFESRARNGYRTAGAEIIGELGLGRSVMRIFVRTQPLVIDLRCHTTGKNGLAALHLNRYDPACASSVSVSLSFVNCWAAPGTAAISAPVIIAVPNVHSNPHFVFDTAQRPLHLTAANTIPPTHNGNR